MTEEKLRHLEFIQQAVTRMASNLFLLKGWTVTLIAALFALAAKDSNDVYFVIAYYPPVMFWVLDGYFLSQERRFRALYDHVRKRDDSQIDFSMDTRAVESDGRTSWLRSIFSRTLSVFYGSMITTMLVVMYAIKR